MKTSLDARLKIKLTGGATYVLNPDQVYGLALYLTGQGWGVGEGSVRYLGKLAVPFTAKFSENEYPDMTFNDFMVDCDGRHSDDINIFVSAGNLGEIVSRGALLKELEKFLVQYVSTLLVFPEISDKEEDYLDNTSIFDPGLIKVGETSTGEAVNLSVGHKIQHTIGEKPVVGLYVFTTNQSVPRPPNVRKLVFLMNDGNQQDN